jgi:hypothetical protein
MSQWWGRRSRLPRRAHLALHFRREKDRLEWWMPAVLSANPLPMAEYRRRLPHFHPDDAYLFPPWRLWGSLPSVLPSRPYCPPCRGTPHRGLYGKNPVSAGLVSSMVLWPFSMLTSAVVWSGNVKLQ